METLDFALGYSTGYSLVAVYLSKDYYAIIMLLLMHFSKH